MSNILIIKHGSLGDIAQASGAIQDIYNNHKDDFIYLLTSHVYSDLFKKNPNIKEVIVDKRLSRFNLIYLFSLMKKIKQYKFTKVYDLQNSSRTSFYKRILFPNIGSYKWSSSETTLPANETKKEFDKKPVLERFDHQLKISGLKTSHTLRPDFSWSCSNIDRFISKYNLSDYILLFPFCSEHLEQKKWPYYDQLIKLIKQNHPTLKIVIAPGPGEIEKAKKLDAVSILSEDEAISIPELAGLIKKSKFVVANDTGPAHMAAHLDVKGLALFGSHTTSYKVSIERKNFKAIQVSDLKNLSAEKVFERLIL